MMDLNLVPTWYKIDHTQRTVDFRSHYNKNLSAVASAEIAVNHIIDNYPKPYHVMVSGGVDSQAMLYSWKLFGTDYIPTTVNYKNHNTHDLQELFVFAKKYKINLNIQEFDVLDFYNTQLENYVNEYQLPSPQLTVFLAMTKSLPGTVIFSGNLLAKPCTILNTQIGLTYESNKRPFVPFFFWSCPELAYALLLHRKKINYIERSYSQSYDYKIETYHSLGFPVIPQQKKYNGFEKIKDIYMEKYSHLITTEFKLRNPAKNKWSPYELLLRIPYENKVGLFSYEGILNDDV